MTKMKLKPAKERKEEEQDVEEWLEEPDRKRGGAPQIKFPWEAPEINERVIKVFNLRLPEPDHLKLKWLVSQSDKYNTISEICLEAVQEKISKLLKKYT